MSSQEQRTFSLLELHAIEKVWDAYSLLMDESYPPGTMVQFLDKNTVLIFKMEMTSPVTVPFTQKVMRLRTRLGLGFLLMGLPLIVLSALVWRALCS